MNLETETIALIIVGMVFVVTGIFYYRGKRQGKPVDGWKTGFMLSYIIGLFLIVPADLPWYLLVPGGIFLLIGIFMFVKTTFSHAKQLNEDPSDLMEENL